ncbi:MAG: DUF4087 domain-containing protein [Rhodobacterales bacterium]|nr:DUF4087 domain-containing protein [Rhodobacterales bacterium]
MLRTLLVAAAIAATLPAQAQTTLRCGWYHNPTPGNAILQDADDQWWLSRQGNAPVPGFEDAYTTTFDNRLRFDYADETTDGYGYSCACAEGVFDEDAPAYKNVRSVSRLTEIPLSRCEQDPSLPTP